MPNDPRLNEPTPLAGPAPPTRSDTDVQRPTAAPSADPGGIALSVGARPLPEYELVRRLGRGGFGEVWLAKGPGGFDVALKFVRLGEQAGAVESRALELMKGIRHGNLLPMFGAWQRDDLLIIAMELGDRTLLDRLAEAWQQGHAGIPRDELLDYMRDAARGLDFLNEYRDPAGGAAVGIQHKDVKPQNLLLVGGCVKVADFGLAKVLEHTVTAASGGLTPAYAAPEFFKGEATRWSDQYCLAVSYCQLRGGELPFTGSHVQVMAGHVTQPPDLTMLPAAERAAVARALAKEPDKRWPSCRDFVAALHATATGAPLPPAPAGKERAVPEEPTAAWRSPATPAAPGACGRRRWVPVLSRPWAAASGMIALVAVVAALLMTSMRRPVPPPPALPRTISPVPPSGPLPATGPKLRAPEKRPAEPEKPTDLQREVQRKAEPGEKDRVARAEEHRRREERELRQAQEARRTKEPTAAPRPALLDCTGPDGVRAADVRRAQQVWARYLGRGVEESVEIGDGVTMTFVLVPPGKFRMGSPPGEQEREPFGTNETLHTVTLTEPFDLARTEVTQEQYQALGLPNPSHFKGAKLPVETVSWDEADAWAKKLTKKLDDNHRYRLPTEAEWEYACRGGRASSDPFGIGGGRALSSDLANFNGNAPYGAAPKGKYLESTCPAGSYAGNAPGLCDMHGNVWEWCADWYGPYPEGDATNPTGPAVGPIRVFRGGSWISFAGRCRAAARLSRGLGPGNRGSILGFRLARSLPTGVK